MLIWCYKTKQYDSCITRVRMLHDFNSILLQQLLFKNSICVAGKMNYSSSLLFFFFYNTYISAFLSCLFERSQSVKRKWIARIILVNRAIFFRYFVRVFDFIPSVCTSCPKQTGPMICSCGCIMFFLTSFYRSKGWFSIF